MRNQYMIEVVGTLKCGYDFSHNIRCEPENGVEMPPDEELMRDIPTAVEELKDFYKLAKKDGLSGTMDFDDFTYDISEIARISIVGKVKTYIEGFDEADMHLQPWEALENV